MVGRGHPLVAPTGEAVELTLLGPHSPPAPGSIPRWKKGFYAGPVQLWKGRFSCNELGLWRWRIDVDEQVVNGSSGAIQCINSSSPGALQVDKIHPHTFIYENGERFFPLGNECDWLWALGLEADSTPLSLDAFLDSLEYGGFNMIVLNIYANYTSWHGQNVSRPLRVSPTTITPWNGTSRSSFDLRFWNHYDSMLLNLQQRGFVAHVMVMVENKNVQWPERQSAEDDLFWRYAVSRLQGFSNVVWDISKVLWLVQAGMRHLGPTTDVFSAFPSSPLLSHTGGKYPLDGRVLGVSL